jgi:antitoxin CptB
MREMDLLLTAFAEVELAAMTAADLDLYEALLDQNDQDLLAWVTGQGLPPPRFGPLMARITAATPRLHADLRRSGEI